MFQRLKKTVNSLDDFCQNHSNIKSTENIPTERVGSTDVGSRIEGGIWETDKLLNTDLPTFYEIKAEDLPPFGKKMTQNEPIFSVLTSPNSTEITKLVLNNNTSIMSIYVICYDQ